MTPSDDGHDEQEPSIAEGAAERIPELLERLSVKSVFLVVDADAFRHSGAEQALLPALKRLRVERFEGFRCNPELRDVERGFALFHDGKFDVVVGVGGGSAIDMAKLIGHLGVQDAAPRDVVRGARTLTRDGPPLIAVPTTAGSGSEATRFAVCYVDSRKYSLDHPWLLPDHAIVDPRLTHSMPPALTAACGLDAFCQAVESIWSVGETEVSRGYALEAVGLAVGHLVTAVHGPTPEAREAMCRASHVAGRAIDVSRTTAAHAVSYALTTAKGTPHGFAVALTLAPLLAYNSAVTDADCADPRGVEHVRTRIELLTRALDCDGIEAAQRQIRRLIEEIGGFTRLSQVGVTTDSEIESLVRRVNVERLTNNPRRFTPTALRRLLRDIR